MVISWRLLVIYWWCYGDVTWIMMIYLRILVIYSRIFVNYFRIIVDLPSGQSWTSIFSTWMCLRNPSTNNVEDPKKLTSRTWGVPWLIGHGGTPIDRWMIDFQGTFVTIVIFRMIDLLEHFLIFMEHFQDDWFSWMIKMVLITRATPMETAAGHLLSRGLKTAQWKIRSIPKKWISGKNRSAKNHLQKIHPSWLWLMFTFIQLISLKYLQNIVLR